MKVVTHSQTFHPDEILAIALLERFFIKGTAEVTRTRDPHLLRKANDDPEVFVIDVGFEYNPMMRNFDHHQGDLPVAWPDGTPYSACGLVWAWLRGEGHLPPDPELLDEVEVRFVRMADKLDNGLAPWPVGDTLFAYNRERDQQDGQFELARRVAHEMVDNTFYQCGLELEAKRQVREALHHRFDEVHGILRMSEGGSHSAARLAHELSGNTVNLIVVPRGHDQWILITAPDDLSDPFSKKCPAPEAWRGRSDFHVPLGGRRIPMVFCHKNGFMSIVRGTEADALEVAREIVLSMGLAGQPSALPSGKGPGPG
jgi:urease accessory protein